MHYRISSLKVPSLGEYTGEYIGDCYMELIQGDTRPLHNCSHDFESKWEHAAQRLLALSRKGSLYMRLQRNLARIFTSHDEASQEHGAT